MKPDTVGLIVTPNGIYDRIELRLRRQVSDLDLQRCAEAFGRPFPGAVETVTQFLGGERLLEPRGEDRYDPGVDLIAADAPHVAAGSEMQDRLVSAPGVAKVGNAVLQSPTVKAIAPVGGMLTGYALGSEIGHPWAGGGIGAVANGVARGGIGAVLLRMASLIAPPIAPPMPAASVA